VQVLEGRSDGTELLRFFVRNVDVEFLLEGHDELDRVEAVGAEVLHEAGVVRELVALDPSSSTMMSLTFSSSCFMSIAMGNPQRR